MARSRLGVALLVLPSLACTRPNPAFDADSLAAGTSDELGSESVGVSDSSSSGSTSAASTSESETDTTGVAMDLPEDPVCAVGHALGLRYFNPQDIAPAACPGELTTTGVLVEKDGGLWLNLCTAGCAVCGDTYHPTQIDYDLSAYAGTCVIVEVENPVQEATWCNYEALSVFDGAMPGVPYFVAANRLLPTGSAIPLLGGWPKLLAEQGTLVPDTTCTCSEAGFDEVCCMGEQTFTSYSMLFDGQTVDVGGSAWVGLPGVLEEYEFYVAMAQQRAACTMAPELAWKLHVAG